MIGCFRTVLVAQGSMGIHPFMHLYASTATKNKVLSPEPSLVTTQLQVQLIIAVGQTCSQYNLKLKELH